MGKPCNLTDVGYNDKQIMIIKYDQIYVQHRCNEVQRNLLFGVDKKITSEMLNSIVEVRKVLMSSYGSQQARVFSKNLLKVFLYRLVFITRYYFNKRSSYFLEIF